MGLARVVEEDPMLAVKPSGDYSSWDNDLVA